MKLVFAAAGVLAGAAHAKGGAIEARLAAQAHRADVLGTPGRGQEGKGAKFGIGRSDGGEAVFHQERLAIGAASEFDSAIADFQPGGTDFGGQEQASADHPGFGVEGGQDHRPAFGLRGNGGFQRPLQKFQAFAAA